MAWLGVIIGLILGMAFHSMGAAVLFAVLGGFIAQQLGSKSGSGGKTATNADPASGSTGDLQLQLARMQQDMRALTQRMAAVERQLQGGASASPEPASTPTPEGEAIQADTKRAMPAAVESRKDELAATIAAPAPQVQVPQAPQAKPAMETAAGATPSAGAGSSPSPAAAPAPRTERPRTPPPLPPAEPSWFAQLLQRWIFGGNPLVKIGVLILFLGLAFLLRYVAEHTVVPVELRYAGVAAVGIGLLLFGWRWRNRNDNYGLILQGAGVGVMYLTTLAAMRLHPLIAPEFGFAILFAVASLAAMLAILEDALPLAIVGTLFGFAAPVLASTGTPHHVVFFTYITLINLGIVAIAWFKAWRELNLVGFVSTFFLGCAWARKYWHQELLTTIEPFLLLLFVLYVLITFLFARRTLAQAAGSGSTDFEQHVRDTVPHVSYVDGTLVFGVPLAAFGLQYLMVNHIEYGAAFAALGFGFVYVVLAALLFRKTGMRYALLNETMIALAVIFGSLAIPFGLEQKWTSSAWAIEAAGVYWVGIRQQRVHARAFALLLLFGSAVYFARGIHLAAAGSVLDGSLLGCVMLSAALWWVYRLQRMAPAEQVHGFERELQPWMVAFGAFFVALLPFLLWEMNWAATALAILGTVGVFASQRIAERALTMWSWLYQGIAGLLFMTTLRSATGGSVLGNGWTGLLCTSLIGASMLAGVWALSRGVTREAQDDAPVKPIGGIASLGVLAGLTFINLAPLFVLPWRYAAMVWPLTGIATLWWALRVRHRGATGFALALLAVAGLAHFGNRLFAFGTTVVADVNTPFLHSGFLGPLLIGCAALIGAWLLQRRQSDAVERKLGWSALMWGGAWWAFAWADELVRVLEPDTAHAAMVGTAIVTTWIWSVLARRFAWKEIGQATLAYVPVLMLLAAANWVTPLAHLHPLAGWGALAWPLALGMHLLLLRRQEAWLKIALQDLTHLAGAWLFVVQAAVELHWQFARWTDTDSAWPLLGWMMAPVLYLWALASQRLRKRWPIAGHLDAYAVASAAPMVLYLVAWVWIVNLFSDGSAAPLPYLPLINPLELAQWAVLTGIVVWWWSLRGRSSFAGRLPLMAGMVGVSALAVITGSVARTCHHWGDVPWRLAALLESSLFQTSLSIVWSVLAIGVMIAGNRQRQRWVWIAGATLMAVVVAKLFLVELADRGSLTRIVSFIVVGLLLLVVGYFAPLPPKRGTDSDTSDTVAA
jgi:uncharacterized membrane protein